MVLLNEDTFEEVGYMRLTRLNLIAVVGVILILLVAIVYSLIAYTNIREFIPGYPDDTRNYQFTAGEGVAVDADGTVFVAEGPASIPIARGSFTRYSAD